MEANKNKNKPRSKERGASCQEVASNLYWLGVTRKRILEHGVQGGGPADSDAREGRIWKQIYEVHSRHGWKPMDDTYLKNQLTFKRRAMACLRQLRLCRPLHHHREVYSLQTNVFRDFSITFWTGFGPSCPMHLVTVK
jgi:hypothetical protein